MRFTPAFIEEVKMRCPIEDVISSYVTLKRAGSNLSGLCPFHSEKTPSFSVSPENNLFYCFGCGAGGDTITFIMKAEGLDYPGAIEFLARRAGIPIPEENEKTGGVKRSRILEMNKVAARFFHKMLLQSPEAMEYLTKRGLQMPIIRRFGLGYAPEQFGALTDHLKSQGFTVEEMRVGFLCGISKKTNRPYDYFRGRVIFPIIDVTGNVIAFGGRIIGSGEPKYLNTSDTPAFHKRNNLFALNYAKGCCKEEMILCEGYMDVVSLHAAGFENAVATLGTAITPEQARMMKRYTDKVIIAYDADDAGQRAAEKAFTVLGEAGLETKRLKVEGAKDPDEYIQRFGPERFRKLLDASRSLFEFRFSRVLGKYDITLPQEKIRAAQEFVSVIATFSSSAEREVYIAKCAEVLSIPPDSLRSDVRRAIRRREESAKKEQTRKVIEQTEGIGDRINPDRIKNPKAAAAEEALLGVLLLYPEKLALLSGGETPLTQEDFFTDFGGRIYASILKHATPGEVFDTGLLGEDFTPDEMSRIVKLAMNRASLGNADDKLLTDCLSTLRGEKARAVLDTSELIARRRSQLEKKREGSQ